VADKAQVAARIVDAEVKAGWRAGGWWHSAVLNMAGSAFHRRSAERSEQLDFVGVGDAVEIGVKKYDACSQPSSLVEAGIRIDDRRVHDASRVVRGVVVVNGKIRHG